MQNELLKLETRVVKNETIIITMHTDIQEIKRTMRWLVGIVFSLNSTILGIVAKGFGVL